jgi:hypothetical protein
LKKFESAYKGHGINARKALVKLGLATEKELAYLTDLDVEKRINESDYLVFLDGEDYAILPKETEEKIVWICR